MSRAFLMTCQRLICLILLASLELFAFTGGASAAGKTDRHGFWGSVDLGMGAVAQSERGSEQNSGSFFFGLEGGYTLNPRLLVGLELSGWLLEAGDLYDPCKGEGIEQVYVVTRYYPYSDGRFFVKTGGGYANHWNYNPAEPLNKSGWGYTLGGGYDFEGKYGFCVTPIVSYSGGKMDEEEFHALTLGICVFFP